MPYTAATFPWVHFINGVHRNLDCAGDLDTAYPTRAEGNEAMASARRKTGQAVKMIVGVPGLTELLANVEVLNTDLEHTYRTTNPVVRCTVRRFRNPTRHTLSLIWLIDLGIAIGLQEKKARRYLYDILVSGLERLEKASPRTSGPPTFGVRLVELMVGPRPVGMMGWTQVKLILRDFDQERTKEQVAQAGTHACRQLFNLVAGKCKEVGGNTFAEMQVMPGNRFGENRHWRVRLFCVEGLSTSLPRHAHEVYEVSANSEFAMAAEVAERPDDVSYYARYEGEVWSHRQEQKNWVVYTDIPSPIWGSLIRLGHQGEVYARPSQVLLHDRAKHEYGSDAVAALLDYCQEHGWETELTVLKERTGRLNEDGTHTPTPPQLSYEHDQPYPHLVHKLHPAYLTVTGVS